MAIDLDTAKLEALFGVKPELIADEGVAKISAPRTDVKVSIDGRVMPPFMGLTSWASFQKGKKPGIEAMLMGDLVLFEDEVNPAMSAALDASLEVTALHNHFFFDEPKVYFMHIGGEGSLDSMANGVKTTLDAVKAIRTASRKPAKRFYGKPVSARDAIDGAAIEEILGAKGQAKDGMFKVVIGRKTTAGCGCLVGKAMGVNTWAAFAGNDDEAMVDGDFAVLEDELQPVLKSLRAARINVVAIHHHMIHERPRFIFLHYWGKGKARDLARSLKGALGMTKKEETAQGACCHDDPR